jgi:hypothetical protein
VEGLEFPYRGAIATPLYLTLAPPLPCPISLQKFTNLKFGAVDMKCSSILNFKTFLLCLMVTN